MALYKKINGSRVLTNEDGVPLKTFKILGFVIHSWYKIAEWPAASAEEALKEFKKVNPKAESTYGGGLKAVEQ